MVWEFYLKEKGGNWVAGSSRFLAKRRITKLSRKLEKIECALEDGPEFALSRSLAHLSLAVALLICTVALFTIANTVRITNQIYLANPSLSRTPLDMPPEEARIITQYAPYGNLLALLLTVGNCVKAINVGVGISPKRLQWRKSFYGRERQELIDKYHLSVVDKSSLPVVNKPESSI
jgi:hypothetical protein